MHLVGNDDGVYRVTGLDGSGLGVTRVHETGRDRRIREFAGLVGVFTATETELYHTTDADHGLVVFTIWMAWFVFFGVKWVYPDSQYGE